MKREKKFNFILIMGGLICLLIVRVFFYLNACVKTRDTAAYYAEKLMFSPEIANQIIPYEMLSYKYKAQISSEEYTDAHMSYELLDLYSNPIFQHYNEISVDISLSTEGYKKIPEGYFCVEEQWYYMKHEIDIKPDWLTLKPKVVRWYIKIEKKEKPENYPYKQ